jgi:uncharacterized membrane protein
MWPIAESARLDYGVYASSIGVGSISLLLGGGLPVCFCGCGYAGIKSLDDREFITSFQVMDRIIHNNQPVSLLVWIGSIVTLLVAALIGFWQLNDVAWYLLFIVTLLYLLGVHLPTVFIHLPLNKQLQAKDVTSLNGQGQREARNKFEQRWNLSNLIRTGVACLTSVLLMILLFIL